MNFSSALHSTYRNLRFPDRGAVMELAGAGGFGTGIVLHKCKRGFELPRIWDLTGTPDDPWLKTKLAGVGKDPITWTLSDAHGSFERVEGVLQDWEPLFDG